jgi:hypothetical protein
MRSSEKTRRSAADAIDRSCRPAAHDTVERRDHAAANPGSFIREVVGPAEVLVAHVGEWFGQEATHAPIVPRMRPASVGNGACGVAVRRE